MTKLVYTSEQRERTKDKQTVGKNCIENHNLHKVSRLLPENSLLQLVGYTQRTSDSVGRAESIESRWHLGLVTNSLTKALYLKEKTNKQSNHFREKSFTFKK